MCFFTKSVMRRWVTQSLSCLFHKYEAGSRGIHQAWLNILCKAHQLTHNMLYKTQSVKTSTSESVSLATYASIQRMCLVVSSPTNTTWKNENRTKVSNNK